MLICAVLTAWLFIAPATDGAVKDDSPRRGRAEKLKLKSLEDSLVNLIASCSAYTDEGQGYLKQLKIYKQLLSKQVNDLSPKQVEEISSFRFKVIVSNPLVSSHPILFSTRKQYVVDHHNTATMFRTGETNTASYRGGGSFLKIIDFADNGKVTVLVDPGERGLVRDHEVRWDGKKIVFAMRKDIRDNYHIYEINADGSGITQLTNAKDVFDIDPVYLPGGDIVFSSSREPKYCMCNRHIMGNLFRMAPGGANIRQIGKSTLHEGHSSMLPDGRILYDRWEYVDRNFGDAQGLWTVNPDGTNHAIYYGNNTASPGGVIDGRSIPGTNQAICIFGSCHDRPWGALAILDRSKGVDGREPVVRIWPANAIDRVSVEGTEKWDSFNRFKYNKYEDPFPLDKNYFLVSRMTGRGEEVGIYLVDTFGNEDLLHVEGAGCFDPMPLKAYKAPTVLPTRRNYKNEPGRFYVQNAYVGTHMKGVKPGDIKAVRVVEAPEKRSWTRASWQGQGTIAPSMNWHDFSNKRILGTVAVEEDGSAYFEVPSDTFVFFQLLDKDGMMIHSMRSGTIVQSGEIQGCVGCHENRTADAPKTAAPQAMRRSPSKLKGWYGKPRFFSYAQEVQPVFDKHCVTCHDFGKKAGKKLNLAGDKTVYFNTSYTELWRKKYLKCVGGGPSQIQQSYCWGSHKSKLVEKLRKGHKKVKLSPEELDRIITWVDINAPYYPTYDSAYPLNPTGRSPLDKGQLDRLSKLTGVRFIGSYKGNKGPQVSFDRPELSVCLSKLDVSGERYKEALSIIKAGQKALSQKPRADMGGFAPAAYARKRLMFYDQRKARELEVRKAIQDGRKVYDEGVK